MIDVPNSVSGVKGTPIFEWCMVGVNLRMDTRKTSVEKRLEDMLKIC
jgi:hypothetical protein